jgi:DnaJ domain
MDSTYYDVLGLSPSADQAAIMAAYGQLLAEYGPRTGTDPEAARKIQAVNEAYQVLSDPARRAQYDQALHGQTSPPPGASQPTQVSTTQMVVPASASLPTAPARRSGFPIWLLGILGLCVIVALGLACIGGALAVGGGGLAGLLVPATPKIVVATSVGALTAPSVITQPVETSVVEPTVLSASTQPVETAAPNSGGSGDYITDVVMATSTSGSNFDPIGVTDTFTPSATFHAVVTIAEAPANTNVKAVWYAADVGSAAPANTKIDEYTLTTEGSRNLDYTLKPTTTWPVGTYKVEIYENGTLARTVSFTVQ